MKGFVLGATLLVAGIWGRPAHAQFGPLNRSSNQARNQNQQQGQGQNAVLPLPKGVKSVISIDAQGVLLAAIEDPDNPGEVEYHAYIVNHVYSGGIAKLFGGSVIPTEAFVSPETTNNGNNFNNGNGFNTGLNGGNGFNTGYNNGNNSFPNNPGNPNNTGFPGNPGNLDYGFYSPYADPGLRNPGYPGNNNTNQNNTNQFNPIFNAQRLISPSFKRP